MSSYILSIWPLSLLRRQRSVSKIVSPMKKIVAELNDFARAEQAKVEANAARIEKLKSDSEARTAEAAQAESLAKNYQSLVVS
jgi:hypothetical protein